MGGMDEGDRAASSRQLSNEIHCKILLNDTYVGVCYLGSITVRKAEMTCRFTTGPQVGKYVRLYTQTNYSTYPLKSLRFQTIAERLVSEEKPTARVEAMGEFSSIAARWSSFGRR